MPPTFPSPKSISVFSNNSTSAPLFLACIAAVGVAFYSADFNWGEDGYSWGNLYTIVYMLFHKVANTLKVTLPWG